MENHLNRKPPVIFIADDDEDDVSFVKAAFDELKAHISLRHFYNGKQLLQELSRTAEAPDLFILDLNMPILDGRETLKQIRDNVLFVQIPIVILSTSNQPN